MTNSSLYNRHIKKTHKTSSCNFINNTYVVNIRLFFVRIIVLLQFRLFLRAALRRLYSWKLCYKRTMDGVNNKDCILGVHYTVTNTTDTTECVSSPCIFFFTGATQKTYRMTSFFSRHDNWTPFNEPPVTNMGFQVRKSEQEADLRPITPSKIPVGAWRAEEEKAINRNVISLELQFVQKRL